MAVILKFFVMAMFLNTLISCTSVNNEIKLEDLNKINQQAQSETWSENEASFKRLIAMESDLKMLIDELSQVSDIADTALPDSPNIEINTLQHTQPVEIKTSDVLVESKPEKAKTLDSQKIIEQDNDIEIIEPTEVTDEASLYLALLPSVKMAHHTWMKYKNVLGYRVRGKSPLIEQIMHKDKKLYRLKVATFRQNDAQKICNELTFKGLKCVVSDLVGKSIF